MKRRASKALRDAYHLSRRFRETPPKRVRKIHIKLPKAVMVLGYLESVAYSTVHESDDGTTRQTQGYRHKFHPGSRPLLCAAPGKNQLYLIDGRYHVTERGIVDLDAEGRELDDD